MNSNPHCRTCTAIEKAKKLTALYDMGVLEKEKHKQHKSIVGVDKEILRLKFLCKLPWRKKVAKAELDEINDSKKIVDCRQKCKYLSRQIKKISIKNKINPFCESCLVDQA